MRRLNTMKIIKMLNFQKEFLLFTKQEGLMRVIFMKNSTDKQEPPAKKIKKEPREKGIKFNLNDSYDT